MGFVGDTNPVIVFLLALMLTFLVLGFLVLVCAHVAYFYSQQGRQEALDLARIHPQPCQTCGGAGCSSCSGSKQAKIHCASCGDAGCSICSGGKLDKSESFDSANFGTPLKVQDTTDPPEQSAPPMASNACAQAPELLKWYGGSLLRWNATRQSGELWDRDGLYWEHCGARLPGAEYRQFFASLPVASIEQWVSVRYPHQDEATSAQDAGTLATQEASRGMAENGDTARRQGPSNTLFIEQTLQSLIDSPTAAVGSASTGKVAAEAETERSPSGAATWPLTERRAPMDHVNTTVFDQALDEIEGEVTQQDVPASEAREIDLE